MRLTSTFYKYNCFIYEVVKFQFVGQFNYTSTANL